MSSRYLKHFHPIGIERIPGLATHYEQDLDIFDSETNEIVGRVQGFSSVDGSEAVRDAHRLFAEWVAERERQEPDMNQQ